MSGYRHTRRLLALLLLAPAIHTANLEAQRAPPGYARFASPGAVPQLFAPGVVSTEAYEFAITFTPDMAELYLTRRTDPGPNRIVLIRVSGGGIREAMPAPFSKPAGEYEACVAPDGKRIFFSQDRSPPRVRLTAGPSRSLCLEK